MAHRCKGPWKSWINPPNPLPATPNDGEIKVGDVDPTTGRFSGKHVKSNKPLKEGKCKEESQKHFINFKREEGNEKYHYKGEITHESILGIVTDVVRNGTVTITKMTDAKAKGRRKPQDDGDEVWTAEKTGA